MSEKKGLFLYKELIPNERIDQIKSRIKYYEWRGTTNVKIYNVPLMYVQLCF